MPVGLVSDEDLQRELNRLSDVVPSGRTPTPHQDVIPDGLVVETPKRGRKEGDNNVPDSLRAIIGEEALLNGRQSALGLAKDFGISASSVSAYTKGATSTASYDSPSQSIISHINKSRARAVKRASKTLNQALESITQEKLDYSDAKELAGIAKDMAVVIKNLEPQAVPEDASGTRAPQFVIFAPQFRKEESFEVIDVGE